MIAAQRLRDLSPHWLALLLIIRLAATGTAVVLLAVHQVTSFDGTLILVVAAYGLVTVAAGRRWPQLVLQPSAWVVDVVVVLTLVWLSGDWRSPFYLLALTTLAIPSAAMRPAQGALLGAAFAIVYAALGRVIGPNPFRLGTETTVETLATHLVLPIMVGFGIAYAAAAVRELRAERRRSERLAIEAERRRIAWELHDSAKQRVHAAHLVLSAVSGTLPAEARDAAAQVLRELEAASTEMDTSLAELQAPLEGRPLDEALRTRAHELAVRGGPQIAVRGDAPALDALSAAHAYRIAAEAMTNAVRHANAEVVEVTLSTEDGRATITVADDGCGMPHVPRARSSGLRAMSNRAATIGAELRLGARGEGTGTVVELCIPIHNERGDRS